MAIERKNTQTRREEALIVSNDYHSKEGYTTSLFAAWQRASGYLKAALFPSFQGQGGT